MGSAALALLAGPGSLRTKMVPVDVRLKAFFTSTRTSFVSPGATSTST
jgi:hypothetical protein